MKELSKKIITEEYLNGELVSRVIEEVYSNKEKFFSDINTRPVLTFEEPTRSKHDYEVVGRDINSSPTITFEKAPGRKYDSSKEYLINGRRTLLL